MDAGEPAPLRVLLGGEALLSPGDNKKYGKVLAEELSSWACRMGDVRIARHFALRMQSLDEGAYLPDLARRLTVGCPDLIAKLDAGERQVLTDAAAKATNTGTAGSTAQAPAPAPR
jgi:hypothetical protein